jgi:hypothetical protein
MRKHSVIQNINDFAPDPFQISQFLNSVLALGIEHLTASKEKVDVTLPAQFTWTADTV